MMIQVTITPDAESTKKMFFQVRPLISFRAAVRQATAQLEKEVLRLAPKATGEYRRSIRSNVEEFDDPYRMLGRVYSTHPAADTIEFGADPHTVPLRSILRWMQAKGLRISSKLTVEEVAYRIQRKIEEQGLSPHYVFTQALDAAESIFRTAVDPVISALGGNVEYAVELRSSGSHELSW